MSHTIKIDDKIYDQISSLRLGGQTFSDVISELLTTQSRLFEVVSLLEGSRRFREWQNERMAKAARADAGRDSEALPDMPVY